VPGQTYQHSYMCAKPPRIEHQYSGEMQPGRQQNSRLEPRSAKQTACAPIVPRLGNPIPRHHTSPARSTVARERKTHGPWGPSASARPAPHHPGVSRRSQSRCSSWPRSCSDASLARVRRPKVANGIAICQKAEAQLRKLANGREPFPHNTRLSSACRFSRRSPSGKCSDRGLTGCDHRHGANSCGPWRLACCSVMAAPPRHIGAALTGGPGGGGADRRWWRRIHRGVARVPAEVGELSPPCLRPTGLAALRRPGPLAWPRSWWNQNEPNKVSRPGSYRSGAASSANRAELFPRMGMGWHGCKRAGCSKGVRRGRPYWPPLNRFFVGGRNSPVNPGAGYLPAAPGGARWWPSSQTPKCPETRRRASRPLTAALFEQLSPGCPSRCD